MKAPNLATNLETDRLHVLTLNPKSSEIVLNPRKKVLPLPGPRTNRSRRYARITVSVEYVRPSSAS